MAKDFVLQVKIKVMLDDKKDSIINDLDEIDKQYNSPRYKRDNHAKR